MEYQQIGAWRHEPAASTDGFPSGSCPGTQPVRVRWVVFGTLLGPEATGPGLPLVLVCFWFPGCTDCTVDPFGGCVWGVWYGVVV